MDLAFRSILNRPSSIYDEAIDCMPQANSNTSMAEPPKRQVLRLELNSC
jgi:hypothetical protein